MSGEQGLPNGWDQIQEGATTLIAEREWLEPLRRMGLHRGATRVGLGFTKSTGVGRGGTAVVDVDGRQLRIKQLRRGGLLRGLWCDRFLGRQRLLDNLRLPHAAIERGVATAAAHALLIVEGPRGLFQGWLALEEIDRTVTLGDRLADNGPVAEEELAAAMAAIRRMHDAGIEHRDLNLGNVLIRRPEASGWFGYVIDLDRARLHSAPLGLALRRRSLRRLERSYVKRFGSGGPLATSDWTALRRLYAQGDRRLAEQLVQGRRLDRLGIAVHRLGGWR